MMRHSIPARGQAALETLLITLLLVIGIWGVGAWRGEGDGVMAQLLGALRLWHQRFAATLALPV